MAVEIKECKDPKEWDSLVGNSFNNTLFHTWEWLKAVEAHTSGRLYPLVANMGSNTIGLLPVFLVKKRGFRLVFSPPPKTGLPYLGQLLVNYDSKIKQQTIEGNTLSLTDGFSKYIQKELRPNYLRLSFGPGYEDARPLLWNNYSVLTEYTYMLDLSEGEESVFQNYKKQLRVDIKKTEREGVTFSEGGKDDIRLIHDSLTERFIEQGLATNISLDYLYDLFDRFSPDRLRVFRAEYKGDYVGGFIGIIHNDRLAYWVGGSKTDLKGIYPNDLLQWGAMKWAIRNGIKKYEIVGAGDERLRQFKAKFNPELAVWYQAEKYSPAILKHIEGPTRYLYGKIRRGGVI